MFLKNHKYKILLAVVLLFSTFFYCNLRGKSVDAALLSTNYSNHISHVKNVAKTKGYNTRYAVLVDFSVHSGKKRWHIVDLETEKIVDEYSALVTHGSGCGQKNARPEGFSNVPGSLCSSLGLSVIAERDWSGWGVKYKYWLDGLDSTNNNMRKRIVVIHSWGGIPNTEIYPAPIIQSEGCFTLSDNYMKKLDEFLKAEKEFGNLLLYAFE
jgi:hypothetical protein